MVARLDETVVQTIKSAARRLTGAARRAFQAEATRDYCNGKPRTAEGVFGWSRNAVQKGLDEQDSGEIVLDQPKTGRPSFSRQWPDLQKDIRSLVDPNSKTHPTFENTFRDLPSRRFELPLAVQNRRTVASLPVRTCRQKGTAVVFLI